MKTKTTFDSHIKAKKIILHKSKHCHYNVKNHENGFIVLESKVLDHPDTISARTLTMIDESVSNLKSGKVSIPADLSDFD